MKEKDEKKNMRREGQRRLNHKLDFNVGTRGGIGFLSDLVLE